MAKDDVPYLVDVTGRRYRYQRKIPREISWCWKSRSIIKALGTNNKRAAAKAVGIINNKVEQIFMDCRLKLIGVTDSRRAIEAIIGDEGGSTEITLVQLCNKYEAQYGTKWSSKGSSEFWKAINSINAIIGENKPPRFVDDGVMTSVRDTLLGSMTEVSVNKYLSRVSAVFNYAISTKLLQSNPVVGVKFPITKNAKKAASYKAYTDEDVKWVFEEMLKKPGEKRWCTYMYWLPILAAFSGARLGDLCELKKENVIQRDNDIWCIMIGNQKTGDLPRPVPVHQMLARIGFLKWIESLGKNEKLFNVTQRPEDGQYDYKWYYNHLRKGVDDEQKVFHSWRKTVSNKLNNQGVPATWRADLLGHERKTDCETDKSYTDDTEVIVLSEALNKLYYSRIDWDKVVLPEYKEHYNLHRH